MGLVIFSVLISAVVAAAVARYVAGGRPTPPSKHSVRCGKKGCAIDETHAHLPGGHVLWTEWTGENNQPLIRQVPEVEGMEALRQRVVYLEHELDYLERILRGKAAPSTIPASLWALWHIADGRWIQSIWGGDWTSRFRSIAKEQAEKYGDAVSVVGYDPKKTPEIGVEPEPQDGTAGN